MRSTLESLDPHEEFIVGRNLVLCLGPVIEVDAGEATVGVDLDLLALNKLAGEGLLAVVFEVEDDLVPALVELEGHRALEGLDAGDGLVVGADEGPLNVLFVEEGHLEAEVLIELGEGGVRS